MSGADSLCSWAELTEYEKREVIFRGWPAFGGWPDNNVRYRALKRYDQDAGELALVRWERVR